MNRKPANAEMIEGFVAAVFANGNTNVLIQPLHGDDIWHAQLSDKKAYCGRPTNKYNSTEKLPIEHIHDKYFCKSCFSKLKQFTDKPSLAFAREHGAK